MLTWFGWTIFPRIFFPTCFYLGKDKREILLGGLNGGREAATSYSSLSLLLIWCLTSLAWGSGCVLYCSTFLWILLQLLWLLGQVGVFSSVTRGPRFCSILIPLKWETTSNLLGFSPSWAPAHTQRFQSALASPTPHPSSVFYFAFKFQHPTEKPQPYRVCFVSSHKSHSRCPQTDPNNFPVVYFYDWTPTDTQHLQNMSTHCWDSS